MTDRFDRIANNFMGANVENKPYCDNLAIVLCTYFEDHIDRPDNDKCEEGGDSTWSPWVTDKYQEARKIVSGEIASALRQAEADGINQCLALVREIQMGFLSEEYATGQTISSFQERFACGQIAIAIQALLNEENEK